jgi:hypothetical protein
VVFWVYGYFVVAPMAASIARSAAENAKTAFMLSSRTQLEGTSSCKEKIGSVRRRLSSSKNSNKRAEVQNGFASAYRRCAGANERSLPPTEHKIETHRTKGLKAKPLHTISPHEPSQ